MWCVDVSSGSAADPRGLTKAVSAPSYQGTPGSGGEGGGSCLRGVLLCLQPQGGVGCRGMLWGMAEEDFGVTLGTLVRKRRRSRCTALTR